MSLDIATTTNTATTTATQQSTAATTTDIVAYYQFSLLHTINESDFIAASKWRAVKCKHKAKSLLKAFT